MPYNHSATAYNTALKNTIGNFLEDDKRVYRFITSLIFADICPTLYFFIRTAISTENDEDEDSRLKVIPKMTSSLKERILIVLNTFLNSEISENTLESDYDKFMESKKCFVEFILNEEEQIINIKYTAPNNDKRIEWFDNLMFTFFNDVLPFKDISNKNFENNSDDAFDKCFENGFDYSFNQYFEDASDGVSNDDFNNFEKTFKEALKYVFDERFKNACKVVAFITNYTIKIPNKHYELCEPFKDFFEENKNLITTENLEIVASFVFGYTMYEGCYASIEQLENFLRYLKDKKLYQKEKALCDAIFEKYFNDYDSKMFTDYYMGKYFESFNYCQNFVTD